MILSGKLAVGVDCRANGTRLQHAGQPGGRERGLKRNGRQIMEIARAGVYVRTSPPRTIDAISFHHAYQRRSAQIGNPSLLELRLVVENLAMGLAIPAPDPRRRQRLGTTATASGLRAIPNAAAFVFKFHHELCVLSGNTLLPRIFYSFREPVIL